jgi:hypothetical protein
MDLGSRYLGPLAKTSLREVLLIIDKRSFLKLSFANKGLGGINLGNILHHKSDKSKIPPYFKASV